VSDARAQILSFTILTTQGHVVRLGGPTSGIFVAGRCDIFIPHFKDDRSGYYVLPVKSPSFRTAGLKPLKPVIILQRCPSSNVSVFNAAVQDDLGKEPSATHPDTVSSKAPTTSHKRGLADIDTDATIDAQDSQVAPADSIKVTDAATAVVRTLLKSSADLRLATARARTLTSRFSHSITMIILVQYVDNSGICYNCREIVDDFYADVRDDGHINLNFVGDLTWWIGVSYTYDHATGAISTDQETFVDKILDQYDMSNCNRCVLPMAVGADLASLPLSDMPDKDIVAEYAKLVGELLYICINTVPEIMYDLGALTRYMTRGTSQHYVYVKQVLRYLKGVKHLKLT
jgi:hypothetical protein